MTTTCDPSLLRKRKTVEAASFVARGVGLLATVAFLAEAMGPMSHHPPPALRTSLWLGVLLMLIANVLTAVNHRRPESPYYSALSAVQVALDTSTVTGIVVWAQGYNAQTAWPLLIIAIVVGAYRHRLAGALVVWAVTTAGFGLAMKIIPQPALREGEVLTAAVIGLIVAVLCGIQGDAYSQQVKELERARQALHHQAHHDPLTGLPNRDQVASFAATQRGRALAVLLLDLNAFKLVNDTLGHAAGDRLLQEVGRRLSAGLRAGDLAGRIGGDEFVVLMPGASPATAGELAARLREEICRPVDIDGTPAVVGASIGIACRDAGSDLGLDALTRTADEEMYRDKVASR
ncbi:diguanylate cyclase [Actinoplanes sp. CA-142083]|uniref:diguanylate cyclase n=1 Tax=Actinoplanes sp. CA-142083 TaxID=3239903 RepID=UPI003D8EE680